MTSVGAYEAKTNLPKLIEKVIRGETIEITRHGVPVAKLVPITEQPDPAFVVDEIRRLRKGKRLKGISAKELITEGRE